MNAGKHALVTGGIRGIGLEISKALLRSNLEKLCVVDKDKHKITVAMLRHDFPAREIIFQQCDLTKRDDIDRCYQKVLAKFQKLDIVVNNAAIIDDTNCDRTLHTNLCGLINSSLLGMNYMSKENGGRGGYVINLASTSGLGPTYFLPIYSASKAGVVGFTRSMSHNDYYFKKTGVKFICICPGLTLTNINDNLKEKFIYNEFKQVFDNEVLAKAEFQDIAVTGSCVLRAMEADRNGSVFVCDMDKIKQVDLKEFSEQFVYKNLHAVE